LFPIHNLLSTRFLKETTVHNDTKQAVKLQISTLSWRWRHYISSKLWYPPARIYVIM